MELLKKQVEAAKHCLHITKKFESAKTIAGACYKKKQRFAKHICHYFKSCTMVQPVMLAYIYIWLSFSLSSSLYIILHLHLHNHIRCSCCPSSQFLPSCRSSLWSIQSIADNGTGWNSPKIAPVGTALEWQLELRVPQILAMMETCKKMPCIRRPLLDKIVKLALGPTWHIMIGIGIDRGVGVDRARARE